MSEERTCVNCAHCYTVWGDNIYGCGRDEEGCEHRQPVGNFPAHIIKDVLHEVARASGIHGPFHSPHEGLGIIEEEFEELKKVVWQKRPDTWELRKEATHVACTVLRFLEGLCYEEEQ